MSDMLDVQEGKPYIFNPSGLELRKVLTYYGLINGNEGTEVKIICPFHKDINPSMIVDLEIGKFYCFGCNLFGDVVKFVSLMNPTLNELQSVRKMIKILNSNKVNRIKHSSNIKIRKKKANETLYDIAYDYYFGLSKIDWEHDDSIEVMEARDYMMKRGFNPRTLNKCEAKVTYNESYEIIFPMFDNDMFKGWVCRTTLRDVEKKRKYLYNEGFSRANTLVGKYDNCDYVFVVEGYMDRLKFIQYGITNVIAILGWKMSYEQEHKLKKSNVKYIISALDNDECGKKGTEYLRTIFQNVIRFCYMKNIKDPGQMSKREFDKMYQKTMLKFERKKQNGIIRQN